jgi:antitoxin component YwqK of YwqJK toxin-antitoxin module
MKENKYHGTYLAWDKAGHLRSCIEYCMDRFCGEVMGWDSSGVILTEKHYTSNSKAIGLHRTYYSADRPRRFTAFDSLGRKNGWEVFWYANGNVKDSILFRNDSTMQRTSFYHNGRISTKEKDIYGNDGYDAISYTPEGSKTGEIRNGTGMILVCDSVGGDCRKLTFKNGEDVFDGKGGK